MKQLNQRICAVCGKTDKASKSATSPFSRLLASLVAANRITLRRPDSQFAHAKCIARRKEKSQK